MIVKKVGGNSFSISQSVKTSLDWTYSDSSTSRVGEDTCLKNDDKSKSMLITSIACDARKARGTTSCIKT